MSAQYPDPVTQPYAPPRSRVDLGILRDVVGLILVLAGVVGLAVAAFATDWRLGVAVLSVAAISAGAYLAYSR